MAIQEINELKQLDFAKQLTFAYLICERLYPNYLFFSNKYSFGNPTVLREAIDYVSSNIIKNESDKERINSFIKKVDKNIPQPANYNTVLASSALDACTAINESLDFLMDKKTSRLEDISTMATDSVDMYIQEKENLSYNTDKQFQQKIDNHPLMIKEVLIQKGIITYLHTISSINLSDIDTLIKLQSNNRGNLNL